MGSRIPTLVATSVRTVGDLPFTRLELVCLVVAGCSFALSILALRRVGARSDRTRRGA